MPRRRAKKDNLLDHKKASVSVHRNGLVIEVSDVTASDAGLVAKALLDSVRELVRAGYDELIQDAGGVQSGALAEIADEDGVEEYRELPTLAKPDKRVGFIT